MIPLFPLIIGPTERALLADLTARAAASPTDYATMKKMAEAHQAGGVDGRLRELNRALTVDIPQGYTVTLTMDALGFRNKIGALAMWLETLDDGTTCPNFVEPLDGDMARLGSEQMPR